MRQKALWLLLCLTLLAGLYGGCTPDDAYTAMSADNTAQIIVEIPAGSSVQSMGAILEQNGLIRKADYFKERVKTLGVDSKLKAGKYAFSKSMTMDALIDVIVKGDVFRDLIKVTIPEGYEVRQIVEELVKAGLVQEESFYALMTDTTYDDAFLADLPEGPMRYEGFLFPATYSFERGATEEQVLRAMIDKFGSVFSAAYDAQSDTFGLSVYELITLASIIEREGQVREELTQISSVFHNRIQQNMNLESCATIQYALGERKAKLYNKDLEIDSPYNTYKNPGLPIGPIASPGEAAILAALHPDETPYLFFVLSNKGDGSHVFSQTYAEHLKAKKANE